MGNRVGLTVCGQVPNELLSSLVNSPPDATSSPL